MKDLVPVSERALVARIRRKLKSTQEGGWVRSLRCCRESSRSHETLGDYYIVGSNGIEDRGFSRSPSSRGQTIEDLARKLDVLAEWEKQEG